MRKTQVSELDDTTSADMLPECTFDYSKARPNRFASRTKESVVVVLDPDIAQVFTTSESVNAILRAIITTMPKSVQRHIVHK